jgi:hypothetical protein
MATSRAALRQKQLDRLEGQAGSGGTDLAARQAAATQPKREKPPRTMSQAEFSGYDKRVAPVKKAGGGAVTSAGSGTAAYRKRGWGAARGGKC